MKQIGIFDETRALERLSKLGDKLEWLNQVINWRVFEDLLDEAKPDKSRTEKGGRPPLPNLMMFKVLILQFLYNVADDQTEFFINDRLTWQRFLGLSLSDKAPDATSIWIFRELLKDSGIYEDLFMRFNVSMEELGVITHKGSIVDASFVDVPQQRNTREENQKIKEGDVPEAWKDDLAKMAQKDLDATWAVKNKETHYGYKDHALVDAESKIIVDYRVTGANVHDSQKLLDFVNENLKELWADSAYRSAATIQWFEENYPEIKLHIHEKGYKNQPLTDVQKANNKEKSRTRVRVEHVFGHMTNSMGGMFIRCIGIDRAECAIGLKNLVYNLSRYATLCRLGRAPKMA